MTHDQISIPGAAYVSSWIFKSQKKMFVWGKGRGENILDGGAHFYETYRTSDNKYMAVGSIEPQFYKVLLEKLNLRYSKCFENILLASMKD